MAKKSIFAGLIDARQRQANRYVNGYLLNMNDETLKANGLDRKEIARKASSHFPY